MASGSVIKRAFDIVDEWRFGLLLIMLLALVILQPLLHKLAVGELVMIFLIGAILAGAFRVTVPGKPIAVIGYAATLIWVLALLYREATGGTSQEGNLIAIAATLGLAGLNGWCTMSALVGERENGANALYGAIFGYILIALVWSQIYMLTELWAPGSFSLPDDDDSWNTFFYFSLVTMTTLGYGDILPVSAFTRTLAGLQAAFGTLYIAVLIGRIVNAFK